MLRTTLLTFLFGFAQLAGAQLPKKVKYDSVLYSKDSSRAMVNYKGRESIYDIEKREYDGEPGKYTFIYLPEVDCFFGRSVEGAKTKINEPRQTGVNRKGGGYLLEHYERNGDGDPFGYTYSFVTFDAQVWFAYRPAEEILDAPHLWSACVEDIVADTVFEAPYGKNHHLRYNAPKAYYVASGNRMGIALPAKEGERLALKWKAKPEEFVHYNPDLDFEFWLENDSIYFKSSDNYGVVSQKQGRITYKKDLDRPATDENFELTLTDSNKGAHVANGGDTAGVNFNLATIEIKNGFLIVNDACTTHVNGHDLESENSSVWKKENGRWTKISPYYASIQSIPGGFIAKSGIYQNTSAMDGIHISARYFLLDSNCRVVPFMDYYDFALIEDLGFGLKVSFDNSGCFFMTYDRVAVTNAEWDHFELFEGKLQATKFEKPLLDESGNQVYDENGVPLQASQKVTMFFKIP